MTTSAASRLRLSVLDQAPISEGSTLGTALRNSIALAVLAESMGYHRYWVAEHHGSPGLGCMSPEILIEPIAAATSRIRVGSGGVMLPHYLNVSRKSQQISEGPHKQRLLKRHRVGNRERLRKERFDLPVAYPRTDLTSLISAYPQRFWITGRLCLL